MYDSYITRHFYRFALSHQVAFAIVSDKFGLHFSDESMDYYDIHPSTLSSQQRTALGLIVARKAAERGFTRIAFYNNSPLMSLPYFDILAASNLPVLFLTRLPEPAKSGALHQSRVT
jgi:hypothetical protein